MAMDVLLGSMSHWRWIVHNQVINHLGDEVLKVYRVG